MCFEGDPNISTGVHYKDSNNKGENEMINLIHWGLRDTLLSGFEDSMKMDDKNIKLVIKNFQQWNEHKIHIMYVLFGIALLLTSNVIA